MVSATLDHPAILLVDTRSASLRRLSDALCRAGLAVIEATSFDDAKHALLEHHPDVLISALRLAAFNGLHLVHLGRLVNPDLNAIILSTDRDIPLHDEVHLVGATLLIEPLHTPTLLELVKSRRLSFDDRRCSERRQANRIGHVPERRTGDRRGASRSNAQVDSAVDNVRPS